MLLSNTFFLQWYRPVRLKQRRTVKIKPIALLVIELHLSEGISQSVSQSENSTEYKIL